jgi:hypothetical protein
MIGKCNLNLSGTIPWVWVCIKKASEHRRTCTHQLISLCSWGYSKQLLQIPANLTSLQWWTISWKRWTKLKIKPFFLKLLVRVFYQSNMDEKKTMCLLFFFFLKILLIYSIHICAQFMCVCVCVCVCVCMYVYIYMPAHQKIPLWMVVSHHVVAGIWTLDHEKNRQCS